MLATHFNSPVMGEFLQSIPPTTTTNLDLSHYEDIGGFLDRTNEKKECEIMVDVRINCKADARDRVLSKLNTLSQSLIKSDWAGTLTFLVLKSLDNDQGIRIFQRFESWKAKADLESAQTVLEFWLTSKDDILSMESQVYVPNGKGWLHRGQAGGVVNSRL